MTGPEDARCVLHVDMDSFFVSVEILSHPELRGRPVVVGGTGARGVVASASYEARAYGVHSAMPTTRARRLCPQAVFLQGDHRRYSDVSRRVMAIFGSFTPLVEPVSLDEAFLDVTGSDRLHGSGPEIGSAIRREVKASEGLECSVGVAPNKFVAKLASEVAKPSASPAGPVPGPGLVTVTSDGVEAFLRPLPVQKLWGVGPATLARLERLGVSTVGDLAVLPKPAIQAALGEAVGAQLHDLAHARDDRPVVPDQVPRSISHEETFATDHRSRPDLERELVGMADSVGTRLRTLGYSGRTVTVKVRFGDFRTITRSSTLSVPIDSSALIAREAKRLFRTVDPAPGVRLIGVAVSGLAADCGARQLSLHGLDQQLWEDADEAVDQIRARFGEDAIGPAVTVGPSGIRPKLTGDRQWGPHRE
ncbi:MAG: DNA polymerase IV 1 [Acidimicrobiales bacterium]|nr:MAG: DNA polymerase IV [Actinomycetota bacterium]MBV6508771.1 DNA polymerase IV 1 [Acidimicrobiales bacterium]RIK06494.1 MAG: DNA polymerase IV [Acidobacteriota bacterium]